ncbi:MAG: precorrin-6y C5,15-methyltransferase (decarboxylating) subunit CbiE [Pseudomonadota bacterium]
MSARPWLTFVGLGEDGVRGLPKASLDALAAAEVIAGAPRHLALVPEFAAERLVWPVPFVDGIPALLRLRGRQVAMLVSGDPFWHGAGTVLSRHLALGEWHALPAPSTFSLAAAALGWAVETTLCLGLHAAPFARLRPSLAPGVRALVLVRDGEAVGKLAEWLTVEGFGSTQMHVLEALGGPRQRQRQRLAVADALDFTDIAHPVAVGLEVAGEGATVPLVSGRPDTLFAHDGQLTKRPVRALTLSALAPRPFERLWDIGAGAGSIAIEWLLAHASTEADAIEANPTRAARLQANAQRLGADRLHLVQARAPEGLDALARPDAVFIGGGLSETLLTRLWALLPAGCRIVANAVTLEAEALLAQWHQSEGGNLLRIELAEAQPLGSRRGWQARYPVVQWSVTR